MRPAGNRVRERFESGEIAVGGTVITGSPMLVELFGDLGLDFVWVDFEHAFRSPWDGVLVEHLTRAGDAGGTSVMVRLPTGDPALVRKVLDAGVRNVLVPRVETAAEVRRAVEATRFEHDGAYGDRGWAGVRANAYGLDAEGYADREDDEVLLGVMVENPTAIDNLADILAVPELGFLFIGPADLSTAMGHPGEPTHPEVTEAVDSVLAQAGDAGVPVGGVLMGREPADLVEDGYRMVVVGSDIGGAMTQVQDRLDDLSFRE